MKSKTQTKESKIEDKQFNEKMSAARAIVSTKYYIPTVIPNSAAIRLTLYYLYCMERYSENISPDKDTRIEEAGQIIER